MADRAGNVITTPFTMTEAGMLAPGRPLLPTDDDLDFYRETQAEWFMQRPSIQFWHAETELEYPEGFVERTFTEYQDHRTIDRLASMQMGDLVRVRRQHGDEIIEERWFLVLAFGTAEIDKPRWAEILQT